MNQTLLKYGTYLGGALVGIALLLHIIGLNDESVVSSTSNIIFIFGIAMFLRMYRDSELGGFISYGKSVSAGFFISVFASVLFAVYYYIYLKTNPDALQKLMDLIYENYYNSGVSEEQLSQMMEIMEMFMGPGFYAFSSFMGNLIFGTIISLITSIFTKRNNPNPFDNIST